MGIVDRIKNAISTKPYPHHTTHTAYHEIFYNQETGDWVAKMLMVRGGDCVEEFTGHAVTRSEATKAAHVQIRKVQDKYLRVQ